MNCSPVYTKTVCAVLLWFVHAPALATGDDSPSYPTVGESAPPLDVEKLLQAPDAASTDWEYLKGKVVILEFWATWCAPCVKAIPILNELEARFEDEPVVFISITDEDEPTITKFMQDTTMRGWVGLDLDQSVFESYGVEGRPRTMVIDRDGRFAGWISPRKLARSPRILRDLIAGKSPKEISDSPPRCVEGGVLVIEGEALKDKGLSEYQSDIYEDSPGGGDEVEEQRGWCYIVIRPTKDRLESAKHEGFINTRRAFKYEERTLRYLISRLYHYSDPRIVGTSSVLEDDRKYDLAVRWPIGPRDFPETLAKQAIEGTFGLRISRVKRETDVYVLDVAEGSQPSLVPNAVMASGGWSLSFDEETGNYAPSQEILNRMKAGEEFFTAYGSTGNLAGDLSNTLGVPVVDEAKIKGFYDFVFPFPYSYEEPNHEKLFAIFRDKYGLTLSPARREIKMLLVEDRQSAD